jgi:predicted oxidoreductase
MKYRTIGTDPTTRREVSVLSLGTMHFGTATDEATSFALLDRYVAAGGTFVDTANAYGYWTGTQGGESEAVLGRWRRSRGIGDEIVIATKLGVRPLAPGTSHIDNAEGLSAAVIRESSRRSRDRLGLPRLDLLYAHIDDPKVPPAETVAAFAALVAEGSVGLLGVSNHWGWQVERARNLAAAASLPGYEVLQYQHSYLRPRTDLPGQRSPDGMPGLLGGDLLSYVRAEPQLAIVAYAPLLRGGYVRRDKLDAAEFAVEPSALQHLPDHALLLTVPGRGGPDLRAVECDPAIVTLPGVSTRPLAQVRVPAQLGAPRPAPAASKRP